MLDKRTPIFFALLFASAVFAGYSVNVGKTITDANLACPIEPNSCYGLLDINVGALADILLKPYVKKSTIVEEMFKNLSKDLSETEYITKTTQFINKSMSPVEASQIVILETLKLIYQSFNSKNKYQLAVFTAHAIHNTSAFHVLAESGSDEWKSRGLLMIRGKEHYEQLDLLYHLTNPGYFTSSPRRLEVLDYAAISTTVRWYESLTKPGSDYLTYEESLDQLKPKDWTCWKEKYEKCTAEEQWRLLNRTLIFEELLRLYY